MIRQWSHSRLVVFEQCPYRAKLAYIDKIPEPERPLPPGKTEHANDRGTRVHTAAEDFCMGKLDNVIDELTTFKSEILHLRELCKEGRASLEGEWAYDEAWRPVEWRSNKCWARVKLDAFVHLSDEEGVVIDYKTGKRFGNEVKHTEQMRLYQLAAFFRYPKLKKIYVELWYTDLDELHDLEFTRDQGTRALVGFNQRALALTQAQEFPPRPSIFNCRWCPYGPDASGDCEFGISKFPKRAKGGNPSIRKSGSDDSSLS